MAAKIPFTEQEKERGLRITLVGRHLYVTDAMKQHAQEKLSKMDRFHPQMLDVHVTMDIQKQQHLVDILVHLEHPYEHSRGPLRVKVSAQTADMYTSIDQAVDKLQTKIRRWKERIQDHHRKSRSEIDMQVQVLNRPFDDLDFINESIDAENRKREMEEYQPPQIVGSEKKPLKLLTTEEAIMKMELSDDHFLLFRDEQDRKLKVIYRRNDGQYGLLLPE